MSDETFRAKLKNDPKKTLNEFLPQDVEIPEPVSINIIEETPASLTIVLPPSQTSELSEEELDSVSAGGYWDRFDDDWNHP